MDRCASYIILYQLIYMYTHRTLAYILWQRPKTIKNWCQVQSDVHRNPSASSSKRQGPHKVFSPWAITRPHLRLPQTGLEDWVSGSSALVAPEIQPNSTVLAHSEELTEANHTFILLRDLVNTSQGSTSVTPPLRVDPGRTSNEPLDPQKDLFVSFHINLISYHMLW